ncbi:hypothetical protein [Streptomyces sp. NPDC088794]|uniref:hypothetical protein n=1 Tax=Streptomyces sp. NPDC088794 TaxID=3365902 RepID=UPI003823CA3C
MTKSGAGGPKARARKAQQATGVRYTQVRRAASTNHNGRTLQFLLEAKHDFGILAVQLAAAWARQGMRVLLVHDYEPYRSDLALYSRRVRERKAAEQQQREWPGHRSTLVWRASAGRAADGLLVEQHTPWSARSADRQDAATDSAPLRDALQWGRRHFDAVVVMGRQTWPQRELVDHFIVLAASDGVPVAETLTHGAAPEECRERVLTAEQSAALLRERHLNFLYYRPPAFLGMITGSRRQPPAEPQPGFVRAVEADMAAAGIPLLGHVHLGDHGLASHLQRRHRAALVAASPLDPGIEDAAQAIADRW